MKKEEFSIKLTTGPKKVTEYIDKIIKSIESGKSSLNVGNEVFILNPKKIIGFEIKVSLMEGEEKLILKLKWDEKEEHSKELRILSDIKSNKEE